MNIHILAVISFLSIISPISVLAGSYNTNTQNNIDLFNNDFLKNTYISIGYGKSLPFGKLKGLTIDPDATIQEHYIKNKLKKSDVFKISLGKKFDNIRLEYEFLYFRKHKYNFTSYNNAFEENAFHKLHTSHYTSFINSFYDFDNVNIFKPYLGLGIGISKNKISKENVDGIDSPFYQANKKSSIKFAWNASLGVVIDMNEHLFLDFSYKYIDLGKVKGTVFRTNTNATSDNNNIKGRFRNNVFLISAGFKF